MVEGTFATKVQVPTFSNTTVALPAPEALQTPDVMELIVGVTPELLLAVTTNDALPMVWSAMTGTVIVGAAWVMPKAPELLALK